jgi:signal peptidase I
MNFALFMFVALLVTGGVWLLDHLVTRRHRGPDEKEPWWVEYSKSFFPVILIVFVLRSFLVEPFKIPSGSMIPTLLVGDFILVNKFAYGIRLPIINRKIIDIGEPKRGDVMVFRYPRDPSVDYIKRVVGLPGDTITYRNKQIFVNGTPVKLQENGQYSYVESGLNYVTVNLERETLGQHVHSIIVQPEQKTYEPTQVEDFPGREDCSYKQDEFTCTIPAGHYFMMGDNRDRSNDSRYWGFVPDANIVGKAFLIWWNFDHLKRIGNSIN